MKVIPAILKSASFLLLFFILTDAGLSLGQETTADSKPHSATQDLVSKYWKEMELVEKAKKKIRKFYSKNKSFPSQEEFRKMLGNSKNPDKYFFEVQDEDFKIGFTAENGRRFFNISEEGSEKNMWYIGDEDFENEPPYHTEKEEVIFEKFKFKPKYIQLHGKSTVDVSVEFGGDDQEGRWKEIKISGKKEVEVWLHKNGSPDRPVFAGYCGWKDKPILDLLGTKCLLRETPKDRIKNVSLYFYRMDSDKISDVEVDYSDVQEHWKILTAGRQEPIYIGSVSWDKSGWHVLGFTLEPQNKELRELGTDGGVQSLTTSPDGKRSIFRVSSGASADNEYWIFDNQTKKEPFYLGYQQLRQGTVTWHGNKIFSLTHDSSFGAGYWVSLFYSMADLSHPATIDNWLDIDSEREIYTSFSPPKEGQNSCTLTVGRLFGTDPSEKEDIGIPMNQEQLDCVIEFYRSEKSANIVGDHVDFGFKCEDASKIQKTYYPKLLKSSKK